MTDTYQAVYDGVRASISNGDVGGAVRDAASQCFDISFLKEHAQQAVYQIANEWSRPSAVYRPTLSADGDMWCALLGEDLQIGVAGFGKTPAEAMAAFDQAFWNEKTPAAQAIEARRAVNAEGGAVEDESAVGKADAPISSSPEPHGLQHD
jgi:hypothetical protein